MIYFLHLIFLFLLHIRRHFKSNVMFNMILLRLKKSWNLSKDDDIEFFKTKKKNVLENSMNRMRAGK